MIGTNRISTIGKTATKVLQNQDFKMVQYHNTVVAKWNDKVIILNHGGYMTATTKRRMNQAAATFNLCFEVFQRQGNWYVQQAGFRAIPFENGMQLTRH